MKNFFNSVLSFFKKYNVIELSVLIVGIILIITYFFVPIISIYSLSSTIDKFQTTMSYFDFTFGKIFELEISDNFLYTQYTTSYETLISGVGVYIFLLLIPLLIVTCILFIRTVLGDILITVGSIFLIALTITTSNMEDEYFGLTESASVDFRYNVGAYIYIILSSCLIVIGIYRIITGFILDAINEEPEEEVHYFDKNYKEENNNSSNIEEISTNEVELIKENDK